MYARLERSGDDDTAAISYFSQAIRVSTRCLPPHLSRSVHQAITQFVNPWNKPVAKTFLVYTCMYNLYIYTYDLPTFLVPRGKCCYAPALESESGYDYLRKESASKPKGSVYLRKPRQGIWEYICLEPPGMEVHSTGIYSKYHIERVTGRSLIKPRSGVVEHTYISLFLHYFELVISSFKSFC